MKGWDAGAYVRQSRLQAAMADEALARLDLASAEHVLDVGCGDGKITAKIAERVPQGSVLGVDPSPEMIAHATSYFGPEGHPNLRFAVGDARHLPVRRAFDAVVSFNALHWVPEQEEALRFIHAALRPGSRALLRLVPGGPRMSVEGVIEEVRTSGEWATSFRGFRRPYVHPNQQDYRALAEQSGFHVDEIQVHDEAWDFGTREAFAAFLRATVVAWTSLLPEEERGRFIEQVLDRYRDVAVGSPGEANTFKFYQMDVTLTS